MFLPECGTLQSTIYTQQQRQQHRRTKQLSRPVGSSLKVASAVQSSVLQSNCRVYCSTWLQPRRRRSSCLAVKSASRRSTAACSARRGSTSQAREEPRCGSAPLLASLAGLPCLPPIVLHQMEGPLGTKTCCAHPLCRSVCSATAPPAPRFELPLRWRPRPQTHCVALAEAAQTP